MKRIFIVSSLDGEQKEAAVHLLWLKDVIAIWPTSLRKVWYTCINSTQWQKKCTWCKCCCSHCFAARRHHGRKKRRDGIAQDLILPSFCEQRTTCICLLENLNMNKLAFKRWQKTFCMHSVACSSCHYWHMPWFIIMSNYCPLWITACVSNDNCCKPQNASAHNHDWLLSRWWQFCLLSTNRNFPFLEKWRIHFFPNIFTAPLFFSVPTPYPVKSSILHLYPVLSWFYPHVQWLNKKTRK